MGKATISVPGELHFADTATIEYTSSRDPSRLWAKAQCFQNGTLVYAEFAYLGNDANVINDALLTLGPTPSWQGGGADGVITLLYLNSRGVFRPLVDNTFTVLP